MDLPDHFVMPEVHASPGLAGDGIERPGVFNQDATLGDGQGRTRGTNIEAQVKRRAHC